jgi:hypothetical protein
MKQHPVSVALIALALSGCAELPENTAPAAPEITREAAVAAARRDAESHFHITVPQGGALANRTGRYWIIDLRAPDGGGLHYAISTDGAIRERRFIQ